MNVSYELPDGVEIVDSHVHLGDCAIFDADTDERALTGSRARWGIATSVVLPSPGAVDSVAVHDRIAELGREQPGAYFGMVSMNPQLGMGALEEEVRRCVEDLGFVGIKLHPYGHGVPPWSPLGRRLFELAEEFAVPIAVHTGLGAPGALPAMVIPAARAHPALDIVLYHAGAYAYSLEALVVAQECPNVVLETSWCAVHHIRRFVDELGPERVLFGSDIVENVDVEVVKYLTAGLTVEELGACLGANARRIFGLR